MPRLERPDVDLSWEIHGPDPDRSGRGAVLLLHGLGSSGRDWEFQVPALVEAGWSPVTLDARGHGRSGRPPLLEGDSWGVEPMAADAAALLTHLEERFPGLGPVPVVGISMGAMVAAALALDAPERVRCLVLVNAPLDTRVGSWRRRLAFWQLLAIAVLLGPRAVGRHLGRKLFPEDDQEALRETFVERWAENDRLAYVRTLHGLAGWSCVERLGEIRCPTLVVQGELDTVGANPRARAERLPRGRFVEIPGSRHATTVDAARRFNRVVIRWLGG